MSPDAEVGQIQADGVSFGYTGNALVLDNVSFTVASGEFVTLVGPSGCGKSTLLKILAGLLDPMQGVTRGLEAAKIGYIPQEPALLPWRTALQNAALGIELTRRVSPDVVGGLQGIFKEYRLDGCEQKFGNELSGGMAQRVAVIRAITARPDALFCDEPFSAVDYLTRLTLGEMFRQRCKLENITTVMVTHNLEEAIYLSDRIFIMGRSPKGTLDFLEVNAPGSRGEVVSFRETEVFRKLLPVLWARLR